MKAFAQVGGMIAYFILGLIQWYAQVAGLHQVLHWPTFVCGCISTFVAWFPLLGTAAGVWGAHAGWGWGLVAIACALPRYPVGFHAADRRADGCCCYASAPGACVTVKKLLICCAAIALAGCVTSKVATLEAGVYTLSFTDLTGMGSKVQAMERATGAANDYCASHGAGTAHLVNMVDGRTMPLSPYQSSIVFRCMPK